MARPLTSLRFITALAIVIHYIPDFDLFELNKNAFFLYQAVTFFFVLSGL
jgi:peptidoglycan/LPS O-acetylase OafA/YrhL